MNNKKIFAFLISFFYISCFKILHAQSLIWTQSAHPDSLQVNGVSFSIDGSQLLSATNCHPAYIKLYNKTDGTVDWSYEVPMALYCMMGVGFSSNGQYFATIEEMGNILLFDYSQNPPDSLSTISMGTSYAFALAFSPNSTKIAVGGSGGKLQTYNIQTGLIDIDIVAHSNSVTTVSYSSDNLKIATGGSDNKINIWDTTGVLLHALSGHSGDITSVKFSSDNLKLFSASKDNSIMIWDVSNGSLIDSIEVSEKNVNAIEISPDDNYLVSVSADNYIRIWNLNTYNLELSFLQEYSGQPICVAWSPYEDKIVTGTSNGLVTLYDISSTLKIENSSASSDISLYPNPTGNLLQLNLAEKNLNVNYNIINSLGQIINSGNLKSGNNILDVTLLSNGFYTIIPDDIYRSELKFIKCNY
jgi:WD40 repeat protein